MEKRLKQQLEMCHYSWMKSVPHSTGSGDVRPTQEYGNFISYVFEMIFRLLFSKSSIHQYAKCVDLLKHMISNIYLHQGICISLIFKPKLLKRFPWDLVERCVTGLERNT